MSLEVAITSCLNHSLQESLIRAELESAVDTAISSLSVFPEIDSTNTYLLQSDFKYSASLVLAEQQTAGKGRGDKKWQSPAGENIYMSLGLPLQNCTGLHFIPLLTGLAICQAFRALDIPCQIKWPNDIYLEDKKLGGVLVESISTANVTKVAIGMGINVNMQHNPHIDQAWTSLLQVFHRPFDRNILVAKVLNQLFAQLQSLTDFSVDKFLAQWQRFDYLHLKTVTVMENHQLFKARVMGLAQDGSLQVQYLDANGTRINRQLYSAEVSLKPLKV